MSSPTRTRPTCAFVASGGGLKAYAFHVGVLRALEEDGFRRRLSDRLGEQRRTAGHTEIGAYIGSSAGACFVAACASFASMDDAEGVIGLKDSRLPRFSKSTLFRPHAGWLPLRQTTGLFVADGVEKYFRKQLGDNDFRSIGPEIYICATQLNSSRKVIFGPKDSAVEGKYDPYVAYFNDVPISQAIAASMSVPGLFCPYPIANPTSGEAFEYIDGEVRESLSLHIARDNEIELVVVSNAWRPYHYDAAFGSVAQMGISMIITQAVKQMIEQKVDRQRNEFDRYGEAMETIREFGRQEQLPGATVDRLVTAVSKTLRYRPMREIYVAPAADDSRFNLMSSWSFRGDDLEYARDTGYAQAKKALKSWRA